MKKLSDYQGKEAMRLWADLLEPLITIFGDEEVADAFRKKQLVPMAHIMINKYPNETESVILRIDDTPINGVNLVLRLMSILNEVGKDPSVRSFFPSLAAAESPETSFGAAMENTEENPNTSSTM